MGRVKERRSVKMIAGIEGLRLQVAHCCAVSRSIMAGRHVGCCRASRGIYTYLALLASGPFRNFDLGGLSGPSSRLRLEFGQAPHIFSI